MFGALIRMRMFSGYGGERSDIVGQLNKSSIMLLVLHCQAYLTLHWNLTTPSSNQAIGPPILHSEFYLFFLIQTIHINHISH
jgi:hypothetical protein